MLEDNGARRQTALSPTPIGGEYLNERLPPLLGIIMPNGVRFKDANEAKQTVVDVYLYDLYPVLYNVPLLHSKINLADGEDWTPEPGDMVVVAFLGGDFRKPFVMGWFAPAGNAVECLTADAPRYFRSRNGTTETITKDGTRRVHVAKDDVLEVTGNGAVTIGGNLTINVTGDAHITATTAHITAPTEITGNVTITGDVAVTGKISATVSVADPKGTMEEMRGVYNSHTHLLQGLASPQQKMT